MFRSRAAVVAVAWRSVVRGRVGCLPCCRDSSYHVGGKRMENDPKRVIVTEACCEACNIQTICVHHAHFPELRAEGVDAEAAASQLANRLSAAHDGVSDPGHREAIRVALADTRAFLDREGGPHVGRDAARSNVSRKD